MKVGVLASVAAFAAGVAVFGLASGPLAAQAGKSAAAGGGTAFTARTAWGDADLQGKWQFAETATPMERPKQYADRAMDFADASLVAAAEALGTVRVFTIDRRDFLVYRARIGRTLKGFVLVT